MITLFFICCTMLCNIISCFYQLHAGRISEEAGVYLAHLTSYVLQTVRYRVTQPMALRIDRSEGNSTHKSTYLNQPSHLLPHQLLIFFHINYSSSSTTSSTHIVTSCTFRLPRASPLGQQRRGAQHIRPHAHHRCIDRSLYN
jgi:hypothetical protein